MTPQERYDLVIKALVNQDVIFAFAKECMRENSDFEFTADGHGGQLYDCDSGSRIKIRPALEAALFHADFEALATALLTRNDPA